MIVTNVSIRNRTTVFVLMIGCIIGGAWCYATLPREATPDITIPIVLVNTSYHGVSPEDIETSVTMEIEKKLKSLRDVDNITSTSSEGFSAITIEFEPTIDIETALQKVRDKVDQAKGELPEDADDPQVIEVNVSEIPIVIINLEGDVGLVRLKEIADDLKDEIESVNGVLAANVAGGLEREIRVEVDPDRLVSYGIPALELIGLVATENVNVSAGSIDTSDAKFTVRVPGEFRVPSEIRNLVVTTYNGKPVYLTDVAKVSDTFKDRTSLSRVNGKECVSISVQKRAGENILRITDEIKEILAEWEPRLPETVGYRLSLDYSKIIDQMVHDLENNILSGFILVAAVVLIAMGVRNAAFVAMAVPMSMLITFGVLTTLDITLNFVTLFALTLSLGMLVDNAIVIVENIYRHMQEGYSRVEAARMGAAEVAWPVTASTLTTVVGFAPLLFWSDIMGKFMGFIPQTVIITLVASLFVALVMNPAICSRFMRYKKPKNAPTEPKEPGRIVRFYERVVRGALANRIMTVSFAVLMIVLLLLLYDRYNCGQELFPSSEPARAFINVKAPEGSSLESLDAIVAKIEERIAPFVEPEDNIHLFVSNVGAGSGDDVFTGGGAELNRATVSIEFRDFVDRRRPSALTVKEMREAVTDIPGAEIVVKKEENGPPVGEPVTIELSGDDFDTLAALSRQIKDRIKTVPGLVDLKDDYDQARPELRFEVDRARAKLLGLNTDKIGFFLKTAVLGTEVGTYRQGNDEYDIVVRLPLEYRDSPEKIARLMVPTETGRMVPLSSLVDIRYSGGFGSINRKDLDRMVTITASNEGRLSTEVLADCRERLDDLPLPAGYTLEYGGEDEEREKAQSFLTKAFVAAIFMITLVLVSEFDSVSTPLIIMAAVAFSMAGALVGLLVTRQPFGIIMTGIGMISLAGVVVNNGIVLLDYVEKLRTRGLERTEALVRAGMTRLRPVVLTAATTILGLIPMATGISYDFRNFNWILKSESSLWWGQMAMTIIFGLTIATVLTLVLVPTMYSLLDDVRRFLGHAWHPKGELNGGGAGPGEGEAA